MPTTIQRAAPAEENPVTAPRPSTAVQMHWRSSGRLWREVRLDAEVGLAVAMAAGIVGYAVAGHRTIAIAVVALSVALAMAARPAVACVLLGAALPFTQNLAGSSLSLNVSLSDLIILLITAGILAEAAASQAFPALAAL